MKNWLLWMLICILLIALLFQAGTILFKYKDTFNILKYSSYKMKELKWEDSFKKEKLKENRLAIFVDINAKTLQVVEMDTNKTIKKYYIASGKPDTPTPLGSFKIINKAKWGRAFGTRWMELNVPWGKYGIHGTNKPHTIGWAASHGCVRMNNKDVEELYKIIKVGTPVTIWGGVFGPFGNGFRILKPGDRGSDVYEVQKRMKVKGYYPLWIDGIYGEGMKKYVIKFRKDNNLNMTHDVDYELYKALGIELME